MKIPFKFYSYRSYWRAKNFQLRLRFIFKKSVFKVRNVSDNEKLKVKYSSRLVKSVVWNIVKSIVFVALLFWIEQFINKLWYVNQSAIPSWLLKIGNSIPKPIYPSNRETVTEVISIIASVTGVILALFYPVLATIASTAYAKVHSGIRNLLLYEKETQNYLRRLTFLTACSILVLLAMSLNFLPGNLILTLLAANSLLVLFGILKIGLGIYNFLEPSNLSLIVFTNITNIIKNVSIGSPYWKEVSFQTYNRKRASEALENLSTISTICLKDDINETAYKTVTGVSLKALLYYLENKSKIPIDSMWFPQVYEHSSYFESDMTKRELSKNTSTYVAPKISQDRLWFETQILENLSSDLTAITQSGHIRVLNDTILMTLSIVDSAADSIDFSTSKLVFDAILANLTSLQIDKDHLSYSDLQYELGCIQGFTNAINRFQLGVLDKVIQLDSQKIIDEYQKINWSKKDSIYSTDLVVHLYDPLNRFFEYYANEILVEKKRITPDWYLVQLLVSQYLIFISDKIKNVFSLFEEYNLKAINHFSERKYFLLSSFSAHCTYEALDKILYKMEALKSTFQDLDQTEICKGEFKWPKPDFNEIEVNLERYRQENIRNISKNFSELINVKWSSNYPDVFARSYSILCDYLNSCYLENNVKEFKQHFEVFLKTSLSSLGSLNQIFKEKYDQFYNISSQVLLDPIEISGYAYIYSIIYNDPDYWTAVKSAWDEHFTPVKANIELIAVYYKQYKTGGMKINFIEKHEREKTLSTVIEQLNINKRNINDIWANIVFPDSHYSNFYEIAELFIELYLFAFIEAKDATALFRRDIFDRLCRIIDHD